MIARRALLLTLPVRWQPTTTAPDALAPSSGRAFKESEPRVVTRDKIEVTVEPLKEAKSQTPPEPVYDPFKVACADFSK